MTVAGTLALASAVARSPWMIVRDAVASHRQPVLIAGLPRSGSSWLGNVLATGASVRYYREPFSSSWHPEAEPFQYEYVREGEAHEAFDAYTRRAFSGRVPPDRVDQHAWGRYRKLRWWPGQVLVKEVHAILGAARIARTSGASVIVITRHPGSLAASWRRLGETRTFPEWQQVGLPIDRLLDQPNLMADHLKPCRDVLLEARAASAFFQVGAIWGSVYRVLTRQAAAHGWTVVTHESLCLDPEAEFRRLFRTHDLRWTGRTENYLRWSTRTDSQKPFDTRRVSAQEVGKWRDELTRQEVEDVCAAAAPFDTRLYDLSSVFRSSQTPNDLV